VLTPAALSEMAVLEDEVIEEELPPSQSTQVAAAALRATAVSSAVTAGYAAASALSVLLGTGLGICIAGGLFVVAVFVVARLVGYVLAPPDLLSFVQVVAILFALVGGWAGLGCAIAGSAASVAALPRVEWLGFTAAFLAETGSAQRSLPGIMFTAMMLPAVYGLLALSLVYLATMPVIALQIEQALFAQGQPLNWIMESTASWNGLFWYRVVPHAGVPALCLAGLALMGVLMVLRVAPIWLWARRADDH